MIPFDPITLLAALAGASGAAALLSGRAPGMWPRAARAAGAADPSEAPAALVGVERRTLAALEDEVALLRAAAGAVPSPLWRDAGEGGDAAGGAWRNAAARREGVGSGSFDPAELDRLAPGAAPERIRAADGRWWSVQRTERGFLAALPADAVAAAESAARSYAMALVETFAHLPVGLAVFAPDGGLRTFNPALAEMTGLDPATLALRPTLRALLDRLRETGLLSEPDGWEAWAARVDRVEEGSRAGTFLETWTLEDGRSWRVSGRPHPGGALALLIEDATTEAELCRRFRAELEIGQAIADTVPDAIAVFAAGGALVASNAAYAALWGSDPRVSLADPDRASALSTWRAAAGGDAGWDEVEAMLRGGTRASRPCPGPHGSLECSVEPIADGALLVRFAPAPRRGAAADPRGDRAAGGGKGHPAGPGAPGDVAAA